MRTKWREGPRCVGRHGRTTIRQPTLCLSPPMHQYTTSLHFVDMLDPSHPRATNLQYSSATYTLEQIRHRAEIAGRQGYVYNYESVTDVRDFVAKARPPATSPAEALSTVDPSLTLEKAEALVGCSTVPSSPVEQHSSRA